MIAAPSVNALGLAMECHHNDAPSMSMSAELSSPPAQTMVPAWGATAGSDKPNPNKRP